MGFGIGAFIPLYSQTLTSQSSTINFTNISNEYKHLAVSVTGYGTTDNQVIGIRVNGDAGTNYSTTRLVGYSAGTISDRYSNATYFMASANISNVGTTSVLTYIYDYSNSNKYKTFYGLSSDNSEGLSRDIGTWRSYSNISSLSILLLSTGNFVVGTTATIYGIKDSSNANIQGLFVKASGGNDTLVTQDGYKHHIFTTSGNLSVTTGGSVDYLILAGGGGGGAGLSASTIGSGGGGGAGGMLSGTTTLNPGNYTILVGGGGGGAGNSTTQDSSQGSNSSALSLTAIGGGYGGSYAGRSSAGVGGSGGGGFYGGYTGASGTSGQGNAGGNAANLSPAYGHGGGGGKGSVGGNGSGTAGGNGGTGLVWPSGSTTFYAGGGGGGSGHEGYFGGTGGSGVGGSGATGTANAKNAVANTGSGGGGAGNRGIGGTLGGQAGNGSSGIVIVRYALV